MATTVADASTTTATPARTGIVDCDVHVYPRSNDEIKGRLPMPWRDRYGGGGRGFFGNPVHGSRLDSTPPQGEGLTDAQQDSRGERHVRTPCILQYAQPNRRLLVRRPVVRPTGLGPRLPTQAADR